MLKALLAMRMHMCIDMRVGMCVDMCTGMCTLGHNHIDHNQTGKLRRDHPLIIAITIQAITI